MSEKTERSEEKAVETEEVKEETNEVRVQTEPTKESKEKKKKREKGMFNYYKVDEGSGHVKRLRPFCERCGPGYFMADHGNRFTCGHCSFTRYKQNQKIEA